MANWITVSSLGPKAFQGDPNRSHEEALEAMKAHWQAEVASVLPDKPDLIVVPEACDRYANYSVDQRLAYYRARGNGMRDFFAEVARSNACYLAYSAARELEDGTWRNSTQILDRRGAVAGIYNKNHVVVEETTKGGILCGKDAPLIRCDFGTVACAICFDLNFAPLREKYIAQKPDLIVFCSMYHGGLMQRVWAYTCRAHFVGAICGNQCTILNPQGELLAASTNYYHSVTATVNLDCTLAHLDYNGAKFRALKQKYGRGVTLTEPGNLGSVLLSCNREDMTVHDMVREFEIELLDDYWARALKHRAENTEP